jgi:predicted metal-dependent peptidase
MAAKASTTFDETILKRRNIGGSGVNELTLTPEQKRKEQILIAALLVQQPFFANLLLSDTKIVWTDMVSVAATDAYHVFFNPVNIFARPLQEQVFILSHEIMHKVFLHCEIGDKFRREGKVRLSNGKSMDYDASDMNIADDYVINALLNDSGVGRMPSDACFDASLSAKGEESAIDVYDKYVTGKGKRPKGGQPGNQPVPGAGDISGGDVMAPLNPVKDEADMQRREDEAKGKIAAAANAARAMGKLPAGIARMVGDFLEPKVSWQEALKTALSRRVGSDSYDWTQPDRRLIVRDIFFPRSSSFGCGHIYVAADTSGSTYHQAEVFLSETAGMLEEMSPARVTLIWCDATVQRVDEIEDIDDLNHARKLGAQGGGGTDFRPVFKHIRDGGEEPAALVYFTDGYGSFPDLAPDYPVIWAMTTDYKPPFGDIIPVEISDD